MSNFLSLTYTPTYFFNISDLTCNLSSNLIFDVLSYILSLSNISAVSLSYETFNFISSENPPETPGAESPKGERAAQDEVSTVVETLEDMSLSSNSSLDTNDISQEYMDDFDNLGEREGNIGHQNVFMTRLVDLSDICGDIYSMLGYFSVPLLLCL